MIFMTETTAKIVELVGTLPLSERVELERAIELQRLRRLVQEGVDSGPGIPAEEVFERLQAKYAAMPQPK
jgi:antitoxin ParD1/3/4